jgi:hypothetical protein
MELNEKTKKVVDQLNNYPFLKTKAFSDWLGVPHSSINMAVREERNIPEKHLEKVESFLDRFEEIVNDSFKAIHINT